jgi:septal ring factor EnvC (AmiA/AmiB activator)
MHPIFVSEQLRMRHDDLLREAAAARAAAAHVRAARHRRRARLSRAATAVARRAGSPVHPD